MQQIIQAKSEGRHSAKSSEKSKFLNQICLLSITESLVMFLHPCKNLDFEEHNRSLRGNEFTDRPVPKSLPIGWSATMEISQLLLSLLHGWSLDEDLDLVCRERLGLSTPKSRICFGLLSRSGI